MAMAANTVSQTKRNLLMLTFGVRATIDGYLEHVLLAFDYSTFVMNQHVEGALVSSISFAEFKQVQTTGDAVSLFFNRGSPVAFTPLSEEDGSNLYQLLDSIIDNIHEILSKDSSFICNLCDSFRPKICLRHCIVTEKKFKRNKGKSKGIGFLKKPAKKKVNEPAAGQRSSTKLHSGGGSVGYIVMTEGHLLCFKEKSQDIPLYMFPLDSCEFSCRADDNSFSFKCKGTKGTFGLSDVEQKLLWMDTCTKSKSVSDNEVLDLEVKSQNLIHYLGTTFDHEDKEHVGMLKRLWDASHLEEEFCLKGNLWKELGFQRDDPVSDFRATGLLGLENLVYFAEHYPELFLSMCKNQQQASEMEYPFATAGINITYLLMGLLHLSPNRVWYPDFVLHPFFFFDSHAWQELYVIVFRLFDQKWNQMQVGYMGYQEVIEATRESAEELIEKRSVMGVPAIFDMLGILRMDLPNFSTDSSQKSAKAEYSFPVTDAAPAASASVSITTANSNSTNASASLVSASAPLLSAQKIVSAVASGEVNASATSVSEAGNSPEETSKTSRTTKMSKRKARATLPTSTELSSSSPDLNSTLGSSKDTEKKSLSKSRSDQGDLSHVSRSISQDDDESMTPKPRKRRNTRSKTAVELEEKENSSSSSSSASTTKTRHRSRSRSGASDKAALKATDDAEGDKGSSERSERKGRDRHRNRDSKRLSKEKTETRERSGTKDKELKKKEKEKDKDREQKEAESTDTKVPERKEEQSDEVEEIRLRGKQRKSGDSSVSGDYERWKKTQGKELAEGFEGVAEEERKLSTKRKLRNSFSLKRNSGIKKK